MAKLVGLVSIVGELREERTNLVGQLRQVDLALSALGNFNGQATAHKYHVSAAARRKMSFGTKSTLGKIGNQR
jgi:hypothetical protein